MKFIIIIILLGLMVPVTSAFDRTDEMSETKIELYDVPSHIHNNEIVEIKGKLLYEDGTEFQIKYMDNIFVYLYVNGHETYGFSACNASGHFNVYLNYRNMKNPYPYDLKIGKNEIYVVYNGRDSIGLLPTSTAVYYVNINEYPDQNHEGNFGLVKLIGYAKGFFALSWFGMLFTSIGLGCISVQSNDPQIKEKSQYRLFFLLKVLLVVTTLYLLVLYLAP